MDKSKKNIDTNKMKYFTKTSLQYELFAQIASGELISSFPYNSNSFFHRSINCPVFRILSTQIIVVIPGIGIDGSLSGTFTGILSTGTIAPT
ncbi:hypothetical protein MJN51_28270, partial [Salmonella enterica subsp. enterica serovar Kentucky]|nr:hypothetical protein [Salmonella enterica subsp. enterica serovar Kentucky]